MTICSRNLPAVTILSPLSSQLAFASCRRVARGVDNLWKMISDRSNTRILCALRESTASARIPSTAAGTWTWTQKKKICFKLLQHNLFLPARPVVPRQSKLVPLSTPRVSNNTKSSDRRICLARWNNNSKKISNHLSRKGLSFLGDFCFFFYSHLKNSLIFSAQQRHTSTS